MWPGDRKGAEHSISRKDRGTLCWTPMVSLRVIGPFVRQLTQETWKRLCKLSPCPFV